MKGDLLVSFFYNSPSYLVKKNEGDFNGIMTRDELDNLQEDICDVIQYPTTIIDNRLDICTGQKLRADSGRSSFVYCSACSVFRICDKAEQCLDSDNVHANILFMFADDIIQGNVSVVNEKIKNYFMESDRHNYYNTNKNTFPEYVEKNMYCEKLKTDVIVRYLKYMCPIMGLTELIFPIIVEKQVVSVLFVGQLFVKDESEHIQKCRDSLLVSKIEIFEKHFKEYNVSKEEQEFIFDIIKKVDDENNINLYNISGDEEIKKLTIGHKRQTFYNGEELEQYIYNTIYPEIKIAENKITEMLNKRRDRQVSKIVNNSISLLQEKIEKLDLQDNSTDILDLFWNNVQGNLNDLMPQLGITGFAIYTFDEKNINENTFHLVCNGGNDSVDNITKPAESFCVNSKDLDTLKNDKLISTIIGDKLQIKSSASSLLIYHELLTQKCIAHIYLTSPKINKLRKILKKHLLKNLVNIMHEHAIVLNAVEVEKTKKTLRIYRHEISHLNLGLTGIYHNFESPLKLYALPYDKVKDIHDDFKSSIDIMNYMTAEIGLFTGAITNTENILIEEFKIYKELIWKWGTLYNNELKRDSKRIKTVRDESNWEKVLAGRPLIKSDRKLLEVIIYNIVNNAIKYSFFGTNIHINCELIDGGPKQAFKVTDYGNSIASNSMPYQLYFRDENIKYYTTDGNGIGLYVSKVAANLLGIEIKHTCKQICKYNLPLLDNWIELYRTAKLPEILDAQLSFDINDMLLEREKLVRNGLYQDVVNKSFQTKVTNEQVIEEINNPTYEVIFEVII